MIVENNEWYMQGLAADDPGCIHTADEMEEYILSVGFLPMFAGKIAGFSVEEHVVPDRWWTGDPETDPWEWRAVITRRGSVTYGKFFNNKTGFIALEWLPAFANYRRDGYDFDARWEDGLASIRQKKIMDLFMDANADNELFSYEIKAQAGFGKGGEKNFEGTLAGLQMMTYLVCMDFQQKKNKRGEGYGWSTSILCTPEHLFGYDFVRSEYQQDPKVSRERILQQMRKSFPHAADAQILKVIG